MTFPAAGPLPAGHGARTGTVAVLGASGFLGAATLRALVARGGGPIAVTRTPPASPVAGARYARADVTDLSSLVSVLRSADAIVHAVSYTGPDEQRCGTVNLAGTTNVLAAADLLGIEHVVGVSTIGIYGPGPFRGVVEGTRDPAPVTRLSATRAEADRLVRRAGGVTVLPGFVHGAGDRWFGPGLRRIVAALGAWVDEGAALLSVIALEDLGALIADLARTCTAADRGVVFHAAHPIPCTVRDLATTLAGNDFRAPSVSLSYADAVTRAPAAGLTVRQIDLVGRDHTIDGTRLWRRAGRAPEGDRPAQRVPR